MTRHHTPAANIARSPNTIAAALLVAVAVLRGLAANADTSASHTVTVRVVPISAIAIQGGDLSLTISGDPSDGPATASDATSCDLNWVTNQENQKITVATSPVSPSCVLRVAALNPSGGTAAGEVVLGPASQDLVVDVSRGRGRCDLGYSATAFDLTTATTYVHTVTYTIIDAQ